MDGREGRTREGHSVGSGWNPVWGSVPVYPGSGVDTPVEVYRVVVEDRSGSGPRVIEVPPDRRSVDNS